MREKPIKLTRHAADKMSTFGISEDDVRRAAQEPEWTEPDPGGEGKVRAFLRLPHRGNRVIRVIYVEEPDALRIINAFPDRTRRRGPRRRP